MKKCRFVACLVAMMLLVSKSLTRVAQAGRYADMHSYKQDGVITVTGVQEDWMRTYAAVAYGHYEVVEGKIEYQDGTIITGVREHYVVHDRMTVFFNRGKVGQSFTITIKIVSVDTNGVNYPYPYPSSFETFFNSVGVEKYELVMGAPEAKSTRLVTEEVWQGWTEITYIFGVGLRNYRYNRQSTEVPKEDIVGFSDVKVGDWYYATIASAWVNRISEGFPDDTFRPNEHITRAQMAQMIINIIASKQDPGAAGLEYWANLYDSGYYKLKDVTPDQWYAPAVYSVTSPYSIVDPLLFTDENGYFYPDRDATRLDMVEMGYMIIHDRLGFGDRAYLARGGYPDGYEVKLGDTIYPMIDGYPDGIIVYGAEYPVKNEKPVAFPDAADNVAVRIMQRAGVIEGYEDGTFRPDLPVTRAEAAAFCMRLVAEFNLRLFHSPALIDYIMNS